MRAAQKNVLPPPPHYWEQGQIFFYNNQFYGDFYVFQVFSVFFGHYLAKRWPLALPQSSRGGVDDEVKHYEFNTTKVI